MSYARILLATDLSESARDAARLAVGLGSGRTRYFVVHVAPPPTFLDPGTSFASEGLDRRRAETLARVEAWCETSGVPRAEAFVALGGIGREVAHEATRLGADLVVVGHRGQSPVKRVLLGSAARSVLRASPVDVLVARGPAPEEGQPPVRRILVATDFQPPSVRAAARALQLAKEHHASLTLVHVLDPSVWYDVLLEACPPGDEGIEDAVSDRLAEFNRDHLQDRATGVILRGRPAPEIARHVAAHGHDLVVLGTHGAGALERAMLGSTAESIVEHAPCSVLLAR